MSVFLLPSQLTAKCDARQNPEWIFWIQHEKVHSLCLKQIMAKKRSVIQNRVDLQLFRQRLSHTSIKANTTKPTGITLCQL